MATKNVKSTPRAGAALPTKAAKAAVKKRHRPALKMPKTFAGCADLLYTTKEERLAEQKKVDEIEADEKAIKAYLIDELPKSAAGVQGKVARATIVTQDVPRIEDEAKLLAAIKKSPKKWGMLLKTVIDVKLLGEILESDGQKGLPPGVGIFTIKKVSLNKV